MSDSMWEIDSHDWSSLHGVSGDSAKARSVLSKLLEASTDTEWTGALDWLEAYASDLGIPCEATPAVVSCLVAAAVRTDGAKRSAILGTIEELTCGRGIEAYTPQKLDWLRASVGELAACLHLWTHLAQTSSVRDAILCVALLAYCAKHVPGLDVRVRRYLELAEQERPELREDIVAIRKHLDEPAT